MPDSHYPVNEILQRKTLIFHVSFESGEQWTALSLPALPYRCKLISATAVATKAIANTDNGTITIKKSTTAYATITFTASDAIGQSRSAPSVTDTAFETTDQIVIATAKSTAGGKALLVLTVEVLPSHAS